jgi:SAM-dependent methyltransferase
VVDRGHPGAAEWTIRRRSYVQLQARVLAAARQGPARILDAGAGSGWLSHRLTCLGHSAVAVDRLDDEADGLGACRHYPVVFPVVQADFDALPFEASQFDVAVMNASLHYAPDPSATLMEVRRTVAPGGALVVLDSPIFVDDRDGRAMVEDQDRALSAACDLTTVVRPGPGFLTLDVLDRAAARLGMRGRFYGSSGTLSWRLRCQVARLRLGRRPARFGVWVAR